MGIRDRFFEAQQKGFAAGEVEGQTRLEKEMEQAANILFRTDITDKEKRLLLHKRRVQVHAERRKMEDQERSERKFVTILKDFATFVDDPNPKLEPGAHSYIPCTGHGFGN